MTIFTTTGPQKHFTGNAISVNVDFEQFMKQVPKAMSDTGFIIVKRRGTNPVLKDLKLNRNEIMLAHRWLQSTRNPHYRYVNLNLEELLKIPIDGYMPEECVQIIYEEEEEEQEEEKKDGAEEGK